GPPLNSPRRRLSVVLQTSSRLTHSPVQSQLSEESNDAQSPHPNSFRAPHRRNPPPHPDRRRAIPPQTRRNLHPQQPPSHPHPPRHPPIRRIRIHQTLPLRLPRQSQAQTTPRA